MKLSPLACLVPLALASAQSVAETERRWDLDLSTTTLACSALKLAFSSQVLFPGDANYTTQNEGETDTLRRSSFG